MDKFIVEDNIAKLVYDVREPQNSAYKVTVIIESSKGEPLTSRKVRSIFEKARQGIRNPPRIEFVPQPDARN